VGQPLSAGDSLRTGEGNSLAVIELADSKRLELSPGTSVRLPEDGTGSVQLIQGVVRGNEGEHSERPIVVTTNALKVRVEGNRFVLSSASPESLRVDVEAGKAEVVRQRDQKSLTVESGAAVLVHTETEDMTLGSMPRFVTEPKRVLGFPGVWAVFFEPDGKHLLAASYHEVQRFGPGPTPEKTLLSTDRSQGRFAAFSRDGNTLAVYRGHRKEDPVILWDLRTREQRARVDARITDQRCVLAPDASWLATVDRDETPPVAHVWDGKTGERRHSLSSKLRINCLAASPDSTLLALGLLDLGKRAPNRIQLVDARTGEEVGVLRTQAAPLTVMAFSPDGRHLAAGITGQVQVWDVRERELLRTIRGFERVPVSLAWSPDGKILTGGTQDGQVWVWDAGRGEEVQVIRAGTSGVRVLAFAPDGRALLTGGIKRQPIMLWEVTPPQGKPERRQPAKT
jgi:WD40 repeat protein